MTTVKFPKLNNLEWLRLIFAWQVVFVHAGEHLNAPVPSFIRHFPGVPAFFFVSGLLIYAAYLNSPGRTYFENRFLRLFPGLLVVSIAGVGLAVVAHGLPESKERVFQYILWLFSQVTIGQAYNPSIFRDIGVGVINGSLWSITVEILFYFSVPLIVVAERRLRYTVLLLLALSFFLYAVGPHLFTANVYRDKSIFDLLGLTPLVWGWMFGFGMLSAKHFDRILPCLKYAPLLIVPLAVMIPYGEGVAFGSRGNSVGVLYFACYAGLILWLAFCTPYVRLPFDISYGTYIWHMPIFNLLLVLSTPSLPVALSLTALLALASWFLVERPALRLKKKSIHENP